MNSVLKGDDGFPGWTDGQEASKDGGWKMDDEESRTGKHWENMTYISITPCAQKDGSVSIVHDLSPTG